MSKIIIDFNRGCDAQIFDSCIQHHIPDITSDVVLLYDISDDPRTDCNSIIVTSSGQWFITRQTTSQLFDSLQKTLRFHILLQKKLRKEFLTFEKKFRIVLITSYIFLFIHFLIIIIGVVIITAFISKKLVTLFIYTSTKL